MATTHAVQQLLHALFCADTIMDRISVNPYCCHSYQSRKTDRRTVKSQ